MSIYPGWPERIAVLKIRIDACHPMHAAAMATHSRSKAISSGSLACSLPISNDLLLTKREIINQLVMLNECKARSKSVFSQEV